MNKLSLETRAKISIAMKGKAKSPEHAEFCRTARVGFKTNRATKRKLSAATKAYWMRKKIKELS